MNEYIKPHAITCWTASKQVWPDNATASNLFFLLQITWVIYINTIVYPLILILDKSGKFFVFTVHPTITIITKSNGTGVTLMNYVLNIDITLLTFSLSTRPYLVIMVWLGPTLWFVEFDIINFTLIEYGDYYHNFQTFTLQVHFSLRTCAAPFNSGTRRLQHESLAFLESFLNNFFCVI